MKQRNFNTNYAEPTCSYLGAELKQIYPKAMKFELQGVPLTCLTYMLSGGGLGADESSRCREEAELLTGSSFI